MANRRDVNRCESNARGGSRTRTVLSVLRILSAFLTNRYVISSSFRLHLNSFLNWIKPFAASSGSIRLSPRTQTVFGAENVKDHVKARGVSHHAHPSLIMRTLGFFVHWMDSALASRHGSWLLCLHARRDDDGSFALFTDVR